MSNAPGAPWIKVRDFSETTLWISAMNTTTNMPINVNSKIELSEMSPNGMVLRLPKNSCSIGHMLVINIVRRRKHLVPVATSEDEDQLQEMKLNVTAKVEEEEAIDKQFKSVSLKFFQFDENKWADLLMVYSLRQEAIDRLVKTIKE